MTSPEETIREFLDGDEAAFTRIVRNWEGRVYSLAFRVLNSREDAQDVMQDTFLSVYRSVAGLRDLGSFPTWLYRVTLNHCRARWRSRKPEVSLEAPVDGGSGSQPAPEFRDERAPDPETGAERADLIRRALSGLSDEHRLAIILKEYVGLTLEEVAEVMGCPLSTAKSRLYHGLRGVQRNLERLGVTQSGRAGRAE